MVALEIPGHVNPELVEVGEFVQNELGEQILLQQAVINSLFWASAEYFSDDSEDGHEHGHEDGPENGDGYSATESELDSYDDEDHYAEGNVEDSQVDSYEESQPEESDIQVDTDYRKPRDMKNVEFSLSLSGNKFSLLVDPNWNSEELKQVIYDELERRVEKFSVGDCLLDDTIIVGDFIDTQSEIVVILEAIGEELLKNVVFYSAFDEHYFEMDVNIHWTLDALKARLLDATGKAGVEGILLGNDFVTNVSFLRKWMDYGSEITVYFREC